MLDYFSAVVASTMSSLADQNSFIDPVNEQPLLKVQQERSTDGSLHLTLRASNGRELVFHFQSNGEARIVQSLSGSSISDEYIDLTQKMNGEATLSTETEEILISEYILNWVFSAFED